MICNFYIITVISPLAVGCDVFHVTIRQTVAT